MSDYTPIVNYAAKDALLTGNPAKRILGTEITAELNAVQTMSQSKEDESNKGVNNGYAGLDSSGDVPRAQLPPTLAYEDETNVFTSVSIQAGPLAAVTVSSSVPIVAWNETDASANNRLWYLYPNNEQFLMAVNNDAINAETSFIVVNRTGSTIDSIALAATTVTVNGVNVRDGAILNAGSVPNGQISQGSVTQHQAALTIAETQITDGALLARVAGTENITGAWVLTFPSGQIANRGTQNNQTTNTSYVSFQQTGGTENGWAGFGDSTANLRMHNSISAGNINFSTTGAGLVQVNGNDIRSASSLNTGTLADGRVTSGNVTQHQAALAINADQIVTNVATSSSTTYTVGSADQEDVVRLTGASAVTVTVNTSHGFATGDSAAYMRDTAQTITFAASGTTIRSPGSRLAIAEQYGVAVLTCIGTNEFVLSGV